MKKWIFGSLIGLLVVCFAVGTVLAAPIKVGFFAPLTGFAAADGNLGEERRHAGGGESQQFRWDQWEQDRAYRL